MEWRIYISRVGQQINTKMIIERAHKQFIARLCTFFFLTGHDQPIPNNKIDNPRASSPCLNDLLTFCWLYNALYDPKMVKRASGRWYLTYSVSTLFMVLFTNDRVRIQHYDRLSFTKGCQVYNISRIQDIIRCYHEIRKPLHQEQHYIGYTDQFVNYSYW